MSIALKVAAVRKIYESEQEPIVALDGVSFEIHSGEFVALMGPSGCGKSTLLHIVGAMDRPTSGEVWIEEFPIHKLPEEDLTEVRRTRVGFVFQFFYLLPTLTVEENVALPLLLAKKRNVDHEKVRQLIETVGLTHRRSATINQLSGGEMQRTALARAFIHQPSIIVADEPTGNLDSENAHLILDLLQKFALEGTTIVMATHNAIASKYAQRVLHLKDGRFL